MSGTTELRGELSIVGASGDLAKKKTFPSLLRLFERDALPNNTSIFGYARTKMEQNEFHERISPNLKGSSEDSKKKFLDICSYVPGAYDEAEAFQNLTKQIEKVEKERGGDSHNRIFYLALPPNVFASVSAQLKENCYSKSGVNRIVIEKPFGKDLDSCQELIDGMKKLWSEHDTFRIDHYLGKEMVKNILPFRFSNPAVDLSLNKDHVESVEIAFKEPFGTEGRGGYFDEFGIIRDIQQNHLCQVFCLLAMETPQSFSAEDIRDQKVKLLKATKPISTDEVLLGQYTAANDKPGYKDDDTVPKDSNTPTFAALVLHVDNERWKGVPFIIKAGKALDEGSVDIRVQYKPAKNAMVDNAKRNELVIRIQPDEAIYMKCNTKAPGNNSISVPVELDLTYSSRFEDAYIPEAYEALILDCIQGKHSNFVRDDELLASWSIFTPLLHAIDQGKVPCSTYAYGSRGPEKLDEFLNKYQYHYDNQYEWPKTNIAKYVEKVEKHQ
ncbi:hypothetical protein MPSI1_003810 [Malassezia psittaci]|uniref:Glucose-6-phosphate 1-dehydrogenase n=1 Tax=Malassezia psittaci TaxID=1821823 RepID=A0AAF0JFV9_9BASI|nr:hypothetical protein MPSI1_003810 [Malassezia psittaci]